MASLKSVEGKADYRTRLVRANGRDSMLKRSARQHQEVTSAERYRFRLSRRITNIESRRVRWLEHDRHGVRECIAVATVLITRLGEDIQHKAFEFIVDRRNAVVANRSSDDVLEPGALVERAKTRRKCRKEYRISSRHASQCWRSTYRHIPAEG